MKLTKGRIHKILKTNRQTLKRVKKTQYPLSEHTVETDENNLHMHDTTPSFVATIVDDKDANNLLKPRNHFTVRRKKRALNLMTKTLTNYVAVANSNPK